MLHKQLRGTDLHSPSNELVENNTGSTLTALKCVKFNGMGTAFPQITVANGATDIVRGIVQADILTAESGFITVLGFLNNVDTSSWTVNTSLYCGPTGNLQTSPTGLPVAVVMKQHATTGILYVENTGITKADLDSLQFPDALSLELMWLPQYASFYSEISYDLSGKVTDVDLWDTPSKVLHLFNKTFTYNLSDQVTNVTVTRVYDSQSLVKVLTYNLDGSIDTVNRTYTP